MASRRAPIVDLTLVRLIHVAFRRDFSGLVNRIPSLARSDRSNMDKLAGICDHLFQQLHHHHAVEDQEIAPLLARKTADQEAIRSALERMDEQHRAMDPLIREIEGGVRDLAAGGDAASLLESLSELNGRLVEHLEDEERELFPLVERHMTGSEYEAFEQSMKKSLGLKGASTFFPWVLDGASDAHHAQVLGGLPLPLRYLYRHRWQPHYRQTLQLDAL